MSVKFYTTNPTDLLKSFKEKINQKEQDGSIATWEITKSGHFTHKGKQYARDAFFWGEARPQDGVLLFKIIRPQGQVINTRVYGYYHGHLIETFLNHFDTRFRSASASAMPADGDDVQPPK
ncbi:MULTISPECIES: hypothetical protein [unclassified Pseudomonas]|uniref:hypothetical protein n=1 Tax=unclassified Pseudomonas TaxID=196821 RepID=UPI00257E6346|nr:MULTISPECIES: hypothetical protein [unclassified Pseudomonas]